MGKTNNRAAGKWYANREVVPGKRDKQANILPVAETEKQNPLSIDDVTAMIAGQIGQLAPMDEETADLFQRLVKKMIEQAEK